MPSTIIPTTTMLRPLFAAWLSSNTLLWAGIVVGSLIALVLAIVLMRRNWAFMLSLARHPFAKYVAFSVIAHVAIAIWLLSSQLFDVPDPGTGPAAVYVQLGADIGEDEPAAAREQKPWDAPPVAAIEPPAEELPATDTQPETVERPEPELADDTRVDSPLADMQFVNPEEVHTPSPLADQPKPQSPAPSVPLTGTFTQPQFSDSPEQPESVSTRAVPNDAVSNAAAPTESVPEPDAVAQETPEHAFDADPEPIKQPQLDTAFVSETDAEAIASSEDLFPEVPQPRVELPQPGQQATIGEPTFVQSDDQPVTTPAHSASQLSRSAPQQSLTRKDGQSMPALYRDRWATDRLAIARARGGGEDTERAVKAALKWLAMVQGEDGRWDASRYGSGKPNFEGGHDRGRAGLNADTATTGLALLAFLGSGHTHLDGEYPKVIRNGLNFLQQAQRTRRDGSLAGDATGFAAMYCHGIATLAISEAYSLTGDANLRESVQRAVGYTLDSQDRTRGGWRYSPNQPGDTSQLGWQLMGLTSAHYSRLPMPATMRREMDAAWARSSYFLDNVSSGSHRGLAAYQPGYRPSPAMTAEAALCRLFLGTPTNSALISEAANYIVTDLPGSGRVNYYYWYYGTLALYHLQDHRWQRWNSAVKRELLRHQTFDGSWNANSVWGASGGKVYSTAIAALTLEVYYRYRPLTSSKAPEHTARTP